MVDPIDLRAVARIVEEAERALTLKV